MKMFKCKNCGSRKLSYQKYVKCVSNVNKTHQLREQNNDLRGDAEAIKYSRAVSIDATEQFCVVQVICTTHFL